MTPTRKAVTHIKDLVPDPANRRQHNPRNIGMVVDSLHQVGAARSIVIDEHDVILAGNGVTEAAAEAGITKVRVIDASGDELIAVRRTGLTNEQKRALGLYDNRTAELATWNYDQLEVDKAGGLSLQPFWSTEEEATMASHAAAEQIAQMAKEPGSAASDAPVSTDDQHSFVCPLTTDQERIVRAALKAARSVFHVDTTGDALTAALKAWADLQ